MNDRFMPAHTIYCEDTEDTPWQTNIKEVALETISDLCQWEDPHPT